MIQNEHHHHQIIQNTILQTLKQGFWKSRGLVFHWNENTQYGLIFCSSALIDYDLRGGPHVRSRVSCTILYHRRSLSKSCMAAMDQFQRWQFFWGFPWQPLCDWVVPSVIAPHDPLLYYFLLLVIQIRYRTYQTTPPNLVVLVIVLIKWNICAYIFQVNGGHAWPHLGQVFLDVCDPSGVVTGRAPALFPDTMGPPAMSEGHGVHSAPRGEFTWNWKYLSRHCQRWRNLRIVMSSAFTGCHTRLSSSSRDLAVALLCDGWFTAHFWLELHKLLSHLVIGTLTQDPQHRPASLIHVTALAKGEPRCTWTLQEEAAVNKEGKINGTHNNMIMNLCLKEDLMKNGNKTKNSWKHWCLACKYFLSKISCESKSKHRENILKV